ncbi:MAG: hypothetical protein ACRDIV_04765 [Ktedonobacteraceae bacterium]
MVVSMKKTVVMVILALVLLAGLFGWMMLRVEASPSIQFHTGVQSGHVLADGGPNVSCPPPPKNC